MSWSNDPELQELFQGEVLERVERLIEGARAMQSGPVDEQLAGAMLREGHTIKGTGRVMGFEAISRAGQMLEQTWRRVQHGDLDASIALGAALENLSAVLPAAVAADPVSGTPELETALADLTRVLSHDPEPPAAVAPADTAAGTTNERREPVEEPASDLGGLLGALESWAAEESVLVNAGRLYRLINNMAAVRIDVEALHKRSLRVITMLERERAGDGESLNRIAESIDSIRRSAEALESQALELAAVPLREITNTLPQLVRYLAKKTSKEIRFEVVGDDQAVDRQVLERLSDPLRQLVVNAIEHGVETPPQREAVGKPTTALIAVRAMIKDQRLELSVEDDGLGVDWKAVRRTAADKGLLPAAADADDETLRSLLFAPGFSTSIVPSELVGDGTGLTKVAEAVEALYGGVRMRTVPNEGTTVTISVPTSRALQRALLVEAGGQTWGIPDAAIDEVLPRAEVTVIQAPHRREMEWHDRRIAVASFSEVVGLGASGAADLENVVVVASPVGQVGLEVERTLGWRDVAAKELGPLIAGQSHLTGAALLGGGEVVLLVDAGRLAERSRDLPGSSGPAPRVLIVDDSQGVRQIVSGALASAGFDTSVAANVGGAIEHLEEHRVDALVVDFEMPHEDGIALVDVVRARFGDLPVVMVSAVATADDQVRARNAGVDAFFDKSDFREGALAETLRSLLAARSQRSEVGLP